jgi:hypothetical protein
MRGFRPARIVHRLFILPFTLIIAAPACAAGINRERADFTLPPEIRWVENSFGNEPGILFGDPGKPRPYVMPIKWPAGSYGIHRAKDIRYDGAKDEDAILQAWGMGLQPLCLQKRCERAIA